MIFTPDSSKMCCAMLVFLCGVLLDQQQTTDLGALTITPIFRADSLVSASRQITTGPQASNNSAMCEKDVWLPRE